MASVGKASDSDRHAAHGGHLPDLQGDLVLAALLGHGGEQGDLGRVLQRIGEMAVEQASPPVVPGGGQVLDHLDQFAVGEAVAGGGVGRRRPRQGQPGGAQPGERELSVERRRVGAGALEVAGRRGLVAGGGGGAAEPVLGARQAERQARDGGELGEMPARGRRIVEEFERVPAGMELGFGAIGGRFGGMAGRDAVGEPGLAVLDQGA